MVKRTIRLIGRILFAMAVLIGFLLALVVAICITWMFCTGVDWLVEFVRLRGAV